MTTEPTREAIATAYLPKVTRRMGAILSLDAKMEAGRVRYFRPESPPAGAAYAAYDLYDDEAVAAYRKVGAMVVIVDADTGLAPNGLPWGDEAPEDVFAAAWRDGKIHGA